MTKIMPSTESSIEADGARLLIPAATSSNVDSLVQARANEAGYQIDVRLGEKPPAAFYAWKVRLAAENGLAYPAPVAPVAVPTDTDAVTCAVWVGFLYLLGCKRLWSPQPGSTYSREFAGPWAGVTVEQARRGITALSRMRYLVNSGEKSRWATIWLPREAK